MPRELRWAGEDRGGPGALPREVPSVEGTPGTACCRANYRKENSEETALNRADTIERDDSGSTAWD